MMTIETKEKLKRYIGTKELLAVPMDKYTAYKENGWDASEEDKTIQGYFVCYPDNYCSWSPKDVFERSYTKPENDPLGYSALLMKGNYKDRFKAEYIQLKTRYDRLCTMIEKWDNGTLDFVPFTPRNVYDHQLLAMDEYILALETRARYEGIDIKE